MAKAKKNDTPKKPRGNRQAEIPGTERRRIKEIDDLALEYRDLRDERQELQSQEEQKLAELDAACRRHKVGADDEHPYVLLDENQEPLEVFRETVEARMRVRKQRTKGKAKAKSEGGGPGELAKPDAGTAPGDFGGGESVH